MLESTKIYSVLLRLQKQCGGNEKEHLKTHQENKTKENKEKQIQPKNAKMYHCSKLQFLILMLVGG